MTDRFIAALADLNLAPREVLIIGPGLTCPLAALTHTYPQATITLIDVDQRITTTYDAPCIVGDAANLSGKRRFDLIINRHPDLDRRPWAPTYQAAAQVAAPGCTLIVSLYTLNEKQRLSKVMADTPFTVTGRLKPRHPVALSGADRYILVYNRSNKG